MAKQPAALARYWAQKRNKKNVRRSSTMKAKRKSHKVKATIPLAIVAGFMPALADIKNNAPSLGWAGSAMHTGAGLVGYDTVGKSYVGMVQAKAAGIFPLIIGFVAHLAASKLGVNRMLSRAGIPLIRI